MSMNFLIYFLSPYTNVLKGVPIQSGCKSSHLFLPSKLFWNYFWIYF